MNLEQIVRQQFFMRKTPNSLKRDFIIVNKTYGNKTGGIVVTNLGEWPQSFLVQNYRPATEAEILLYG